VRDCCVRVSRIVFRMGVHLPYGLPRVTEGCTDVIGGESVTPDNDPFPRGSLSVGFWKPGFPVTVTVSRARSRHLHGRVTV
jgi:hypothetical protein